MHKRGQPVNLPAAKKKLNELFITWMSLPDTQQLLAPLLRSHDVPTTIKHTAADGKVEVPNVEGIALLTDAEGRGLLVNTNQNLYSPTSPKSSHLQSPPKSPKSSPKHIAPLSHPQVLKGPAFQLKVVDELDHLRAKVGSPPSSPKPSSPKPNAPLSPHAAKAGAFNTHHTTSSSLAPPSYHVAVPNAVPVLAGPPVVAFSSQPPNANPQAPQQSPLHSPSSSPPPGREATLPAPPTALPQAASPSPSPVDNRPQGTPPPLLNGSPAEKPMTPPMENPPSSALIRQFWFPDKDHLSKEDIDKDTKSIVTFFKSTAPQKVPKGAKATAKQATRTFKANTNEFLELCTKVCGFPAWWGNQLFLRLTKGQHTEVGFKLFKEWWDDNMSGWVKSRRMFNFIKNDTSRDYLQKVDFQPFIADLLLVHPGLDFLKQTPEFQEKYAETVNVRIFFTVNRSGTGHLTYKEYCRSKLQEVMLSLDHEEDINTVTDYFSYEHFYVLYCKFWELDNDHDFLISKEDLLRYNGGSLTNGIVDLIFQERPRKLSSGNRQHMNYEDFIWFCLCEEDKTTETSLEYWFRCVDVDQDGIISGYELDSFYNEQKAKMEALNCEQICLEDILCQMIDMINPKEPKYIRLRDIKKCPSSGVFFNVLFNLQKFLAFEQRDPFQAHAEKQGLEKTDWDRFARCEYDRMAMEAEQSEEMSEEQTSGEWGLMGYQ